MKIKNDPFAFKKEGLENGTEIFYRKNETKETHLTLLFKAGGGRYDPEGKEGCAHMLEHLVLKKNLDFPDKIAIEEFVLEHGLEKNGFTNADSIQFVGNSNRKEVNSLFFLLEAIIKRHQLEEYLLKEEKGVVISEIKPRNKNKNWINVELERNNLLFGKNPLNRFLAATGTPQSVSSITIEDILKNKRKFFVAPNLAVIAITDLSLEKIKSEIEKCFKLPTGKINYPKSPKEFPKPAQNFISFSLSKILGSSEENFEKLGETVEFEAIIPTKEIAEEWIVPSLYGENITVGDITGSTIDHSLYRKIRVSRSLMYNSSTSIMKRRDLSRFRIRIGGIPKDKGIKVIDLIHETIANFRKEKKYFELIKRNALSRLINYQALPLKVINLATDQVELHDRIITIQEGIEKIKNFSFEQALDWTENWLNEDRVLTTLFTI